MTNDAKLGMLAGVMGVIVAAVLLTNAPPPPESHARPGATAQPAAIEQGTPAAQPLANTTMVPDPPIPRTRPEAAGRPASRSGGLDEEP